MLDDISKKTPVLLKFKLSVRVIPFQNKFPTEIVNASTVKPFKALLDTNWTQPTNGCEFYTTTTGKGGLS